MSKDKWINIRCTEQERQDITEQAKEHDMSVAELFRYLVAKERDGEMRFYWFEFEDGYRCCVAGMSNQELRVEENKHGKLLRKVEA